MIILVCQDVKLIGKAPGERLLVRQDPLSPGKLELREPWIFQRLTTNKQTKEQS